MLPRNRYQLIKIRNFNEPLTILNFINKLLHLLIITLTYFYLLLTKNLLYFAFNFNTFISKQEKKKSGIYFLVQPISLHVLWLFGQHACRIACLLSFSYLVPFWFLLIQQENSLETLHQTIQCFIHCINCSTIFLYFLNLNATKSKAGK